MLIDGITAVHSCGKDISKMEKEKLNYFIFYNVLNAIITEIYATGVFKKIEKTHNKSLHMDTLSAPLQACQ